MKPLTTDDLERIRQIVSGHWTSIGIQAYGAPAMSAGFSDIQQMVDLGYIAQTTAESIDLVADAFLFGYLRRQMQDEGLKPTSMSLSDFKQYLATNPQSLSSSQRHAIEYAKKWGGQYVKNLAAKTTANFLSKLETIDLQLTQQGDGRGFIGKKTAEALEQRLSPRNLANMLRQEAEDAILDWDRVAITEIQTAHEAGYAEDLFETFGNDVRAAKLVNPDACKDCKRLYIGPSGKPKIFYLRDLMANGDNVGKKRFDWRPIVGAVHPWCHCTLVFVPDGFELDESGNLTKITPHSTTEA